MTSLKNLIYECLLFLDKHRERFLVLTVRYYTFLTKNRTIIDKCLFCFKMLKTFIFIYLGIQIASI